MTDERQQDKRRARALSVLETYGADRSRWPEAERQALAETIETDPLLSERMREEQALDSLLAMAPVETPAYALQTRILAAQAGGQAADAPASVQRLWRQVLAVLWPYGSAAVPAGALAVSIVLGGAAGTLTSAASGTWSEEQSYDVVALALGDTALTEEWQ